MTEGCTVGLPFEKLINVTHYITYITTKEKKIISKYAKKNPFEKIQHH